MYCRQVVSNISCADKKLILGNVEFHGYGIVIYFGMGWLDFLLVQAGGVPFIIEAAYFESLFSTTPIGPIDIAACAVQKFGWTRLLCSRFCWPFFWWLVTHHLGGGGCRSHYYVMSGFWSKNSVMKHLPWPKGIIFLGSGIIFFNLWIDIKFEITNLLLVS